jgi:ribosomal protein S18 acetylase RimI-like enzyme
MGRESNPKRYETAGQEQRKEHINSSFDRRDGKEKFGLTGAEASHIGTSQWIESSGDRSGELDTGVEQSKGEFSTEVFKMTPERWSQIEDDLVRLTEEAQSQRIIRTSDTAREWTWHSFENPHPNNIRVLLLEGDKVIGYSLGGADHTWSDDENSMVAHKTRAKVDTTVIHPDYQGRGVIGTLMEGMELEMRNQGYETFTSHVRSDNGFAESHRRHYGDRIIHNKIVTPDLDYFEIKL